MARLSRTLTLLEKHSLIDSKVFVELLDSLPPGLSTKLRIVPDRDLSKKLAHLMVVARIEQNLENIGFEYECLSVEGIEDDKFFIDHDAIVLNKRKDEITIIDCTSDPSIAFNKLRFMQRRIESHKIITAAIVHEFKAKSFHIEITVPLELKCVNSKVFKMLEDISLWNSKKKDSFFKACEEVYDKVSEEVLVKPRLELDERYSAWDLNESLVEKALLLSRMHRVEDAEDFKEVSSINEASIYYKTFEKILAQHRPINAPFDSMPAKLNNNPDLFEVLTELSENIIAKTLRAAMLHENSWVGINERGQTFFNVSISKATKTMLPEDSEFRLCAKYRGKHIFEIKFSGDVLDDNFKEQILHERKVPKRTDYLSKDVIESYREMLEKYHDYSEEALADSTVMAPNTIMGKILTICQKYSEEPIVPSANASGVLTNVVMTIHKRRLGELINHNYEVAKTFSASLKNSPRVDQYYVGVNGAFSSITIVRMTSTQDSFNTSSYFTLYKPILEDNLKIVKNFHSKTGSVIQSKTRSFNRNTLAHALKLPFAYISLVSWELENNSPENFQLKGRDIGKILMNSILHTSVNSDQFAQCAEQIRYLFTSNVGYGASSAAICDKIDFIRANTIWELLYLFRMLKMACGLNIAFRSKRIGQLVRRGKWDVMFPNSVDPICSFSHLVSSMYYANIYNKFRAFHEISESICFNELEEENVIYLKAVSNNAEYVNGISRDSYNMLSKANFFNSEIFISNEINFCHSLCESGPGRFKFSIAFVIGATRRHVKVNAEDISSVYTALSTSPIEACTMRGAMEAGVSSREHQGIRAASAILEELVEERGLSAKEINESLFQANCSLHDLEANPFDYSILSASARQFVHKGDYRYRIVQKDQKGHREISVLNAKFRIGALVCERTAHSLSNLVPCDVLDNTNKDVTVESEVRASMREGSNKFVISDNSDQKRWGPNHLLHSFSAMFLALLSEDPGLFRIINLALHYGENKKAKFPENLIDLFKDDKMKSKSEPLQKFFTDHVGEMKDGNFEKKFEWGMCQGIFHRTSSLYHGIMCNVVTDVCQRIANFPNHVMLSYVTSDDAERLILIKEDVEDRVGVCKRVHSVINNVGTVMNILRNESKSVFSFHITEFNSIFYHDGYLATPTLKQRISKVDIGEGQDPSLDYLTAISLTMGYFQQGGSYMGTVMMMILNIVMHTEQWNRWRYVSPSSFLRPVEFGGFPVLEPLSVLYCGPISSFYLRVKSKIDSRAYSEFITETTLVDAMEVSLSDFSRNDFDIKQTDDIKVFKSAGPMGTISLSRTDRRLSRFEKRHKLSKWNMLDSFITLNKHDSDAGKFIFNLVKITKTCQFEHETGVNSFFIRFTDPWVNRERKCIRLHPNSLFFKTFGRELSIASEKVSLDDMETYNRILDDDRLKIFYDDLQNRANRTPNKSQMEYRLEVLMSDADKILSTLSSLDDIVYLEAINKNSIVKVNLSTHTNLDEEEFQYSLLKTVIGEKIRPAITKRTGNPDLWEKIKELPGLPGRGIIEGLFFCSNTLQVYDRYVRKSTKLICPGETRPNDISELITQIMENKYTEKFGIKIKNFPALDTARMPANVFRACNSELLERSLRFWREKEDLIDFNASAEPKKFGVRSGVDIITAYENFTISETESIEKIVEIHARGKFAFVQKLKLWTGANVKVRLTDLTRRTLLKGELTNLHEYCIDESTFIKNQTGLSLSVRIQDAQCFHMQEYSRGSYTHNFVSDMGSFSFFPRAEVILSKYKKPWADQIQSFIERKGRFKTDELISVTRLQNGVEIPTGDMIKFIKLTPGDLYEIETFPNNLTIFLRHMRSGLLIPVCSQQVSDLSKMNLGFEYKESDFSEALDNFKIICPELTERGKITAKTAEFVKALLFKTSAYTGIDLLNRISRKNNLGIYVTTKESADIFRTFVLANTAKKLIGNRARIHHYLLNLFRNSASYNNGITRLRTDAVEISEPDIEDEIENEKLDEIIDFAAIDTQSLRESSAVIIEESKAEILKRRQSESITLDLNDSDVIMDDYEVMEIDEDDESFDVEEDMGKTEVSFRAALPLEDNDSIDAGFTIIDSHIVNKFFEETKGIKDFLKMKAVELSPVRKPLFSFHECKTFFQAINTITSCTLLSGGARNINDVIKEVYDYKTNEFYNTKIPFSAICLVVLNFS